MEGLTYHVRNYIVIQKAIQKKKCNCCIEFALQKLTLLAVERMIGCRIKH